MSRPEKLPAKSSAQTTSANSSKKGDLARWLFVILLALAGIVANAYYASVAWAIRAAAGIVLAAIVLWILSFTHPGRLAISFAKAARGELRKVVWPTKPETLQTTIVVVVMVTITALVMWGVDSFFLWGVSWLTGQRG